jgi:hypothetical protein
MIGPSDPRVSVLMPTYQQEAFVSRAVAGLLRQTFHDWELIVVDDGSPDDTHKVVSELPVPRLTYLRLPVNRGLGHALNRATAAATGRYIAYLPSDDWYDPDHLERAVALLDADPGVDLVYGGVRWYPDPRVNVKSPVGRPTLRDDIDPGSERVVLDDPPGPRTGGPLPSGNLLALVQVVHRREAEPHRWTEREESVSDRLEADHWRGLLRAGHRFAWTGTVSCEWTDHPDQRHKIISGRGRQGSDWLRQEFGLAYYKQHYNVAPGTPIRWEPADPSSTVDENVRYARLPVPPPAAADGLRILVAGSLGFNPDRMLAFEERGHELHGLWMPRPHFWDAAGNQPFGRTRPASWESARPDVIYGLLNWQALPFLHRVLEHNRRHWQAPFVFHFKESPFFAQRAGYWPLLRDLVLAADARVYSSPELLDWFATAIPESRGLPRTVAVDGDLPKRDWMTEDWAPRLSDADGVPHTVCVGRPILDDIADLTRLGVHVHLYTQPYMRFGLSPAGDGPASPRLHLHDPVEPADWVAELSRYDAAWTHIFDSANNGDIGRASWNDLNLPARIGTYAAAGLPWIHRAHPGHRVAVDNLAGRLGVGIGYHCASGLADALYDETVTRAAGTAARDRRHELSFDHHTDDLVALMREAIDAARER